MSKKPKVTDDDRLERCKRLLLPWMHDHSLSHWQVRYDFSDKVTGDDAAAAVSSGYPYLWIHIEMERAYMDTRDDEDLTEILVHEVIHVVVFTYLKQFIKNAGLRCTAYDMLEETAVDLVTRLVLQPHVEGG